jgi:hypothetical protein
LTTTIVGGRYTVGCKENANEGSSLKIIEGYMLSSAVGSKVGSSEYSNDGSIVSSCDGSKDGSRLGSVE